MQLALALQRLPGHVLVGLRLARVGLGLPEIRGRENGQRLPGLHDAADFSLDPKDATADLRRHAHGAILVPDQAARQPQRRPLVLFDGGQLEEVGLIGFAEEDAVAVGLDRGFLRRLGFAATGGEDKNQDDAGQVSLHLVFP